MKKNNKRTKNRIISVLLSTVLLATGLVSCKSSSKSKDSSVPTNTAIVSDDDLRDIDSKELESISYDQLESTSSEELESISYDQLVNQYIGNYGETYDAPENEDISLLDSEERLQNIDTFNIENLIVMENTNENGESDLYILNLTNYDGTCYEYYMENTNKDGEHILNVPAGDDGTCYEHCNELKTWFGLNLDIDENAYDVWPGYIYCKNCQPLFNYLTDEEIGSILNNGGKITRTDLDEILVRIRTEYQKQMLENNYSKSLTNN